jgi:hypothetical protein
VPTIIKVEGVSRVLEVADSGRSSDILSGTGDSAPGGARGHVRAGGFGARHLMYEQHDASHATSALSEGAHRLITERSLLSGGGVSEDAES